MPRNLSAAAVALMLVVGAPSVASAQDACGGAWQVPCYSWSWCAWVDPWLGWCWPGLVAQQPWNGCDSSRLNNFGVMCVPCGNGLEPICYYPPACTSSRFNPIGVCLKCGGAGEPACWAQPECDLGLGNSSGLCRGYAAEPTTNVTGLPDQRQPMREDGSVRGIADVHTHMFANLGFGGVMFWGAPYDSRGISSALAWCDYTWDFATRNIWGDLLPVPFVGYAAHGATLVQPVEHPVDLGVPEGFHSVDGPGWFTGWPKYNSYTHQQMYHTWVKRAYEGGVRLMVMLAINSEALCYSQKQRAGWDCDDMKAVDRQLQAAIALEEQIDLFDDGQRNDSGWYRIAKSPSQARELIRDGRMAVVLGIEVDSLFGCKFGSSCTKEHREAELKKYYDLGVRHVFPIHHYDNAFGGSTVMLDLLNIGSVVIAGHQPVVRNCKDQGYDYNVSLNVFDPYSTIINLLRSVFNVPAMDPDYYNQFAADCNAFGLFDTGREFIEQLMSHKFIIDTDHMSRLMVDEVLNMAASRTPHYPLVSSHTNMRDLSPTDEVNGEFSVTNSQIATFKHIGGLIAPNNPRSQCGVSTGYKEILRYAVALMKQDENDKVPHVAFSTDYQGFSGATGPRFGPDSCYLVNYPLVYPFQGPFGGWFDRQVTGQRQFDFNTQGMAHYGLMPDFFADLKAQGMTDEELDPIYNSAEAYIRVWEAIDNTQKPSVAARVSGTLGFNGWYTSDITVEWDVKPASVDDPITSSTGCDPITISSDTAGFTRQCIATAQTGAASSATVTVKRDATPPVVGTSSVRSCASETECSTLTPGTWTNGDITVTFSASDGMSGLLGAADIEVKLTAEGGGQTATTTFSDRAGNTTVASLDGLNIDRTPPSVGFRFASLGPDAGPEAQLAEQLRWHNQPVVLTVSAVDPLSGVASITPAEVVLSAEGVAVRGSATATDHAGNSTTVESFPVKIDLTPPAIAFLGRTPEPNADGWNTSAVTVRWTCSDGLSGVSGSEVARTVETEGAGQSVEGTCTDLAGNSASETVQGINIDKTGPSVVACSIAPASLWPPNNKMVPAKVDVRFADALSGLREYVMAEASSNERDEANDIQGFVVDRPSVSGALRAERDGSGTGRIYTLKYRAVDVAGNPAVCSTVVLVPHDQGRGGARIPQ